MAGSSRAPHAAHAGRLRQPLIATAAVATLLILLWQTSQLYGRTHSTQAAAQLAAQLNATRSALVTSKQLADALSRQLSTASSQKVVAERALAQAQQQQQQAVQQQLQLQQQQLQQLQQQQAVQPSSPQGAPPGSSQAAELAGLHLLEVAGLQCNAVQDQEFWADPVVWGSDHKARDSAECCAACHAYTAAVERGGGEKGRNSSRCNMWAYCADAAKCKERHGECWLKQESKPLPLPPALPPGAHAAPGWVSGAVHPDQEALLQQHKGSSVLVMHTRLGDIRVQLLPDLAPASVREIRRMAVLQARGLTPCSNCRIYRPEPNFLVQGLLEGPGSYVTVPRHPSPPQPMTMPRGMVCWAGGSGGPHWFVNLIDQAGFKDEHLCWGQVADMSLFDAIVGMQTRDKKPGEMNELVEHIRFNVSLAR